MEAYLIDPVPIDGVATTPVIASGESWEAKVRFLFLPEAELTKTLRLTATSVNDPTISDTGEATYLVGRQGTIDLTPSDPISIDEANFIYTMEITVDNRLNPVISPTQTISIDKVDGDWSKYINLKIDDNDRSFRLHLMSLEKLLSRLRLVR